MQGWSQAFHHHGIADQKHILFFAVIGDMRGIACDAAFCFGGSHQLGIERIIIDIVPVFFLVRILDSFFLGDRAYRFLE